MRSYLLGKLDSSEADALEDLYFADRTVLLRLNECEQDLIDSYLTGRLLAEDCERFEQKYLRVPELIRRLDDVRRRRNSSLPAPRAIPQGLYWAVAALVLIAAGAGIQSYLHSLRNSPTQVVKQTAPVQTPLIAIALAPGVFKGGGDGADVALPATKAQIRFQLELPGGGPLVDCRADIAVAEADGHRTTIWRSSGALPMKVAEGSRRIMLDVDSTLLRHADYVVTLRQLNGDVLETYLFRASAH
jgi:hypothetical protein